MLLAEELNRMQEEREAAEAQERREGPHRPKKEKPQPIPNTKNFYDGDEPFGPNVEEFEKIQRDP